MRLIVPFIISLFAAAPALADTPCGGSFSGFVNDLKQEAIAKGHSRTSVESFFASVRQDPKTLRADRSQGVFQKPFLEFSQMLISANRINVGRQKARQHAATFDAVERQYGVSRGVLLAFWGFETDYGAFQGDYNTLNSLVTLAHDCRRPWLFRPQVFAALTLYERGNFDPRTTTGAWAGEIGMVQMLPADILENGVDGDGDGKVSLKTSPQDALMSGANMLRDLGWRKNEPWLQEVVVPADLDWAKSGLDQTMPAAQWAKLGVRPRQGQVANLPASLLLPQGRKGPAFLVYPNFRVFFEWNRSFVYVTTAAYFATRLEGAPVYDRGNPDPGLSGAQMKQLQQKLRARGHDVGGVDGILGAKTRDAVQKEQIRLGLPADAWPTPTLLSRL
ncbi:lytic murein transglycosylase [Salinihabitans flavidus]|uniref:Lytic murein transglycosylase n=1 Tax=Salinihabitans flavidus TaxID=569882 RepID=A0A1H8UXD5_9RHOB|nr:lytic murein transglycosylase [Salinihabitans flavidus]SEP07890.1 lytic murein transglycosylase [Salinihabitans flavidus]